MKIDYDVGDIVVCVDDSPSPEWGPTRIKIGRFYRVRRIGPNAPNSLVNKVGPSVWVEEVEPHSPAGFGWFRFRKLPKADDEFTEYMRSMKPHKQAVEERCPLTGQSLIARQQFESECG